MNIVLFCVGFFIGALAFSLGALQILISVFFGLPLTAKLSKTFKNQFRSSAVYAKFAFTIIFWGVVLSAATYAIIELAPKMLAYGCAGGAGVCFLFSLGKWGINQNNLLDYMKTNAKYMSEEMLWAFSMALKEQNENENT